MNQFVWCEVSHLIIFHASIHSFPPFLCISMQLDLKNAWLKVSVTCHMKWNQMCYLIPFSLSPSPTISLFMSRTKHIHTLASCIRSGTIPLSLRKKDHSKLLYSKFALSVNCSLWRILFLLVKKQ